MDEKVFRRNIEAISKEFSVLGDLFDKSLHKLSEAMLVFPRPWLPESLEQAFVDFNEAELEHFAARFDKTT